MLARCCDNLEGCIETRNIEGASEIDLRTKTGSGKMKDRRREKR